MGKRRKQYAKPPEKYHFEKAVKSTDYADTLYYRTHGLKDAGGGIKYPLYPLAWGWNDSGRAGNITEQYIDEPKRVQQSRDQRYIACASGKHHSLLVSEDGNVFSFGDNKHGQLGYGHPFSTQVIKNEPIQCYPRQVTPTGNLRYERDYKVTEVSCGATFSVAREACHVDAVKFSKGMLALERALVKLIRQYPDALPIQMACVKLRQERYMFTRAYGGQVMTWGTGKSGELGLGKYITYSSIPRAIPALRSVRITQIASGNQHTLAIDDEGRLFSWGCGKSGQLGHDNGVDCFEPRLIAFFDQYYVEQCSAGRSHSAVLMTSRKSSGERNSKLKRLATFGRGAHGRLGVGHNRSLAKPTLVSVWPPSVRPMSLVQVACGGAHTIVLAIKGIPRNLSNPIGVETVVLAFGFGTNGQLGTGYIDNHEYYPVKVKFPRWEIISEISAGKSWSLARTVNGEIFAWGKGLRGQLGMKDKRMSVAPRNLNAFASVLKISSSYAHNVCIATPKKYHNSKIVEREMPAKLSQDAFVYNRSLLQQNKACDMVHLCLSAGEETKVLGTIGCCKIYCHQTTFAGRIELEEALALAKARKTELNAEHESKRKLPPSDSPDRIVKKKTIKKEMKKDGQRVTVRVKPGKKKIDDSDEPPVLVGIITRPVPENSYVRVHPTMQFMRCLDCDVASTCLVCIRVCHANHRVCHISGSEASTVLNDKSLYCHCSALHPGCKIMPFIPEVYEGSDVKDDDDYYDIETQNKLNNKVGIYHPRSSITTDAAICIQRLARAYFGKLQKARLRAQAHTARHEACRNYWEKEVLGEIWGKLQRTVEIYKDSSELLVMRVEEERGRTYNKYYYLQASLKGMNLMNMAIDRLIAGCSLYFPRKSSRREFRLEYDHSHLSIEDFEDNFRPSTRPESMRKRGKVGGGSRFGKSKKSEKPAADAKNGVIKRNLNTPPLPIAEKPQSKENNNAGNCTQLALIRPDSGSDVARSPTPPLQNSKQKKVLSKSGKTASVRTSVKSKETGPKSTLAISKAALSKKINITPVFEHELFAPPLSSKNSGDPKERLQSGDRNLFKHALGNRQCEETQSTRAFCWNSARAIQLRIPLSDMKRLTPEELALASKHFPLYVSPIKERNLLSNDDDIGAVTSKFVGDVYSENRRWSLALAVAKGIQQRDISRITRRRAKVAQQKRAADAMTRANNAEKERDEKRKQEALGRASLAGKGPPTAVTSKKKPIARTVVEKLPPLPELRVHRELPPLRRKSISDPCNLTSRVETAAKNALNLTMGAYGYNLRRPSLPVKLSKLRPRLTLVAYEAQTALLLNQSLELFNLRAGMLFDCLASPLYVFPANTGMAAAMLRFDPTSPQTNVRHLMEYCFLNPRLPCEVNEMLVTDNKRRHTIGEPERLAKQLKILYHIRSSFATIRHQAKRGRFGGMEASHIPKLPSMPYRRRSFDMGEEKDLQAEITTRLGYIYEPAVNHYTINVLKKQSQMLNKMVSKARWNVMGRAIKVVHQEAGVLHVDGEILTDGKAIEGAHTAAFDSTSAVLAPVTSGEKQIEQWQQYFDDKTEASYYHCIETGETTWNEPFGNHIQILTRHENDKGKFFWFNTVTGESHWDIE